MKNNFFLIHNILFNTKRARSKIVLFWFSALFVFCSLCFAEDISGIKIVNWNVQTFFDAQVDGNEYSEFQKQNNGWGREAYEARLDRLCDSIIQMDADIVVLEEIEKQGIIYDITNRLQVNSFKQNKMYKYACFAKDSSSSIGCAVLSRLELKKMTVHSLDIRSENSMQPSMRPLLEIDVSNAKGHTFKLFVNHWKSKSGGTQKSEIWRDWQEAVLAYRMNQAKNDVNCAGFLATGDFNRDILDFKQSENVENIVLVSPPHSLKEEVYSPWQSFDDERGSYYFREEWERIDHFFASSAISLFDFMPEFNGKWADAQGKPFAYRIFNQKGFSDHLPISCRISLPQN